MPQFTASAWAGSSEQTNYEAHNVGDEIVGAAATARWASTNSTVPHWVRADLGSSKVVEWYELTPGQFATSQDPTSWTFEGSDDASSWTTLDTRSSVTWTTHKAQTFTFTNSTAYRYYRLNISHVAGGTGTRTASVAELRMGDGDPPSRLWSNQLHDGNIGGAFTLGVVFRPDVDGYVTALSYLKGTTSSTVTLYLYDTDRNVLASTTHDPTTVPANVWVTVPITPVAVTSGTNYMVAEYNANGHGKVSGNLTSAQTHGDLTILANGSATFDSLSSNPRYGTGTAFPTTTGTANYAPSVVFERASGTAVDVAAPALAVAVVVPAPTVTAGAAVSVAAPSLSLTVAVPAPTVEMGSVVSVAAPVLAVVTVLPAPVVTAGATVAVAAPSLSLVLAVPAPSVSTAAADAEPVDVGVGVGPVVLTPGGAIPTADIVAPVACGVEVTARFIPSPAAPPVGVLSQWPLWRRAHLMPALTSVNRRYRPDLDYTVDRAEGGRLHVFIGGVDFTYLNGSPAGFDDYSSSLPMNSTTAKVALPSVMPWHEEGAGDLVSLDPTQDPSYEVVLVKPDESVTHLWEGFLSSTDDRVTQGSVERSYVAEGIFSQAAHQPHNPPVFMEPTDIGHLIPDALNAVVNRRWSAIPKVTTGILTRNRGTQGQSVLQYVIDLLSVAWTDDERQWTLARVAPYTYRLQLKAVVTETTWTVSKGAHGVEVNLTRDQGARRECIFGRGIDPDGGVWGNWFFPGLDRFNLPPYPMAGFANISVGTTDAGTTTGRGVTDWQRRMRELGFPVVVDGVMNSSDTAYVRKVQALRGVTVDGSLGPQTWAATFDPGMTDPDLTAVRLPLVALPDSEPYLYNANGSKVGPNPLFDSLRVRHAMTEVDFGPGVTKAEATALAARMLARDSVVGWTGTITLTTDPHEAGSTRFEIQPGDNVHIVGHYGGTDVQVSEVSVSGLTVTLTVDERARDALTLDRILERDREARRDPSGRGYSNDRASLNRSDVVQYESESQAGTVPRVAVNGNSGLWTVLPIFVSQVGVAKVEFYATEPKAEMCIALFEKPITANRLASFIPDPLGDDSGWYDNVDTLQDKFGLMEIWGGSSNPAGYWPRQKVGSPTGPLTGVMKERSGALYASQFGGFVWVAMFTSRSTWVRGRVFPAVPQ